MSSYSKSAPHPTSPHFIPPKLAGRLNCPALGTVSLQTSLHSVQNKGTWPSAACTALLQRVSIGKIHLRFDFLMLVHGEFKTGGDLLRKHSTGDRIPFHPRLHMWLGISPARASLPARTRLDGPLGITQPQREQPQCQLTAASLVCNCLMHLTRLGKGTDVAVNNTPMECRICGQSIISMPHTCRAWESMRVIVAYNFVSNCHIRWTNKVALLTLSLVAVLPCPLQNCFHHGKGGTDIIWKRNTVGFHMSESDTSIIPPKHLERRHDPSSCA